MVDSLQNGVYNINIVKVVRKMDIEDIRFLVSIAFSAIVLYLLSVFIIICFN